MSNSYYKQPKYHNQKVVIDGIKFDSKREARRYTYLNDLLQAGIISDLELQPEFEIIPSYKKNGHTIRKIVYKADFRYVQDGKIVVEDVKGIRTDVFNLKKKLVEFFYPDITITLI